MPSHADAWTSLYAAALRNLSDALDALKAAAAPDAPDGALVQLAQGMLAHAADAFCRVDAAAFHAATDGHAYPPSDVAGLPRF